MTAALASKQEVRHPKKTSDNISHGRGQWLLSSSYTDINAVLNTLRDQIQMLRILRTKGKSAIVHGDITNDHSFRQSCLQLVPQNHRPSLQALTSMASRDVLNAMIFQASHGENLSAAAANLLTCFYLSQLYTDSTLDKWQGITVEKMETSLQEPPLLTNHTLWRIFTHRDLDKFREKASTMSHFVRAARAALASPAASTDHRDDLSGEEMNTSN